MRPRFAWKRTVGGCRPPFLLIAGLVALTGCAPGGPAASPQSQPQPNERVAGPPKVLRLDNRQEPYGFSILIGNNLHQREINYSFHAGLTAYNANSELVGRLAAKIPSVADGDWKVNPDGTMDVTWKLRSDVKWHDGTPFTAADVVFGYQLYLDPELPINRTGGLALVQGATVVDPQTLVVRWKSAYFNANLTDLIDFSPVPVHIMGDLYRQDKPAFTSNQYWLNQFVGLGPYRLVQWEAGSFIEGQAFADYFLGRPKIDRIILRFSNDPNASLAAFLAGDLDILTHDLTVADRETARGMRDVTVISWADSTTGAIYQWRDPTAPWVGDANNASALAVRQAMMHMLDRQLMADTFDPGGPGVAHIFIAPSDPVYKLVETRGLAKYPYDPARAAQLMANAGLTKGPDGMLRNSAGQGFRFEVREGNSDSGLAYVDMLRQGGIDAWVYAIPNNAVDRMEQRAKSQGVRVGGGAIAGDFMRQFTTKEVRSEANNWSGLNQGGYVNSDVDRQYDQFLVEFDVGKRNDIETGFHKLIADQALRPTWYYESTGGAFKNSVSGPIPLTSKLVMTWNIQEWDLK